MVYLSALCIKFLAPVAFPLYSSKSHCKLSFSTSHRVSCVTFNFLRATDEITRCERQDDILSIFCYLRLKINYKRISLWYKNISKRVGNAWFTFYCVVLERTIDFLILFGASGEKRCKQYKQGLSEKTRGTQRVKCSFFYVKNSSDIQFCLMACKARFTWMPQCLTLRYYCSII